MNGVPHRTVAAWMLALGLALGLVLSAVGPAAARDVRVRHTMFGMHDDTADLASAGTLHEGWLRVWGSTTRWDHIETRRGVYQWGHLDELVDQALAHHVQLTMVVAMTPSFYSHRPTNVPATSIDRYRAFVRRLMSRYRGRISSYEVWNEANISSYWTGTPHRMAQLTKVMHDVRDTVDPRATILAPSMVTRLSFELKGLSTYLAQRVGGKPVWRYVDATGFSFYPKPTYGGRPGVPEDTLTLLAQVRQRLRQAGWPASMPIWDTEVNYGLKTGSHALEPAEPIRMVRQASYVARTLLLQASHGVKRIGWYRYDWHPISAAGTVGNTLLTDPDDSTRVTAAGRAYALARTWMHGTLRAGPGRTPCPRDGRGTYHCVVSERTGTRHIYWNPFHRVRVTLPKGVRHRQTVLGTTSTIAGGRRVIVDYRPVMYWR